MQVSCPQCQTLYEIDTAQLGDSGQHFKCVNCEFVFFVAPPAPIKPSPVDYSAQFNPYDQATVNFQQQANADQHAGAESGFNPSNLPSEADSGFNPSGFPSQDNQSLPSEFAGFQPPPPNIDFSAGSSNQTGYETEFLNETSGPSMSNEPTTFPMKDHEPPQLDFTPPMTSHAPTELPTGWIPDSSSGTGFPETSQ
ncbi:MAG: zinc-ribbon domain-containing protein, partial [Acidobacteria bacterium]|nr:zinc-ribbon domain-containing protein [Acidobacteriota bacterium]